jgi:hypothetical protein
LACGITKLSIYVESGSILAEVIYNCPAMAIGDYAKKAVLHGASTEAFDSKLRLKILETFRAGRSGGAPGCGEPFALRAKSSAILADRGHRWHP